MVGVGFGPGEAVEHAVAFAAGAFSAGLVAVGLEEVVEAAFVVALDPAVVGLGEEFFGEIPVAGGSVGCGEGLDVDCCGGGYLNSGRFYRRHYCVCVGSGLSVRIGLCAGCSSHLSSCYCCDSAGFGG